MRMCRDSTWSDTTVTGSSIVSNQSTMEGHRARTPSWWKTPDRSATLTPHLSMIFAATPAALDAVGARSLVRLQGDGCSLKTCQFPRVLSALMLSWKIGAGLLKTLLLWSCGNSNSEKEPLPARRWLNHGELGSVQICTVPSPLPATIRWPSALQSTDITIWSPSVSVINGSWLATSQTTTLYH